MPVYRYKGYDLPLQKMRDEEYCLSEEKDIATVRKMFDAEQSNFILAIVNELRATQRELRHVDSLILASLKVLGQNDSNVCLKEFIDGLGLVVRDAHGNEFNPEKELV